MFSGVVRQLLATDVALDKLGARRISAEEVEQLPQNAHVLVRNPRAGHDLGNRLLLVGQTHGGRVLTVVIERHVGRGRVAARDRMGLDAGRA